jgi:hypothetical protein
MKNRTHSLRRKANRFHRQADQARAAGRTFDAAQLRQRALNLEAKADVIDATHPAFDSGAGFRDADLNHLTGCTALPAAIFGGVR